MIGAMGGRCNLNHFLGMVFRKNGALWLSNFLTGCVG